MESNRSLARLRDVGKTYIAGDRSFTALEGASLDLGAGELVAVVGKSGSGKSTLLGLVAGIDRATRGEVIVGGADLTALDEHGLARFRGRMVGIVFQLFHLLPTLTVLENVVLPMDFARRIPRREARGRALELLDRVGIADQADKLPRALSGGQQQRVAIARALANEPPILVADEPTGNLDSATAEAILALFVAEARAGKAVLLATHEPDIAARADRVVTVADGHVLAAGRRAA